MARFYANIQGNRGQATRMGTAISGICGHIRGWSLGAEVLCYVENGEDVCDVYVTGGSAGSARMLAIRITKDSIEYFNLTNIIMKHTYKPVK